MADPPSTAGEASDGQVASIEEDFPQTVFESYSEAHKALEAHAFSAGYSVVVAERWPRGGKEHTRVTFRCGKGRQWVEKQHLAHQTKRRKTSTQMTGCPFKVNIRQQKEGGWIISPTTKPHPHNHDLAPAAAFYGYRNMKLYEYKEEVISWWNSGTRPQKILAKLRNPTSDEVAHGKEPLEVTVVDIYNLLGKHRQLELAGRTPLQWLYDVRFVAILWFLGHLYIR